MSSAQPRLENPGGWGTPFSVVLFFLTALIFILVLCSFGFGCYLYYKGNFIDYQLNPMHSESAIGLVLLFLIPIALQLAALIAIFVRLHKDKSLTGHYTFCIMIMSSCPFSYCSLWVCYMKGWHNWETLSYIALIAIILSLLPVIIMTYAIMWAPLKDSTDWQLSVDDIADLPAFCSELKTDGTALGVYRRRILERLRNNLRNDVMRASYQIEYEKISKADLVDDLNRILRGRDLHLAINFDNNEIGGTARELLIQGQNNLTDGEVQRLHRLLLEASVSGAVRPAQPVQCSWLREKQRYTIKLWGDFLLSIKEGITKAHFWVLANFFAVFLGVTYLFGFAFAFHDQRSIEDKKGPDLYMAKTPPSQTGAMQLENHGAALQPAASVSKYTFYFDSISAHPNLKAHSDFDNEPYKPDDNSPDKSKDWKESINYNQVERISNDILRLTEKGEKLRVELVGSTDYCDLQAAPYSSNYELSEARTQNIKYLLLKRVSEKDKRQRDIEWLSLPVSSEGSPLALTLGDKAKKIKCEEYSQASNLAQKRRPDQYGESELITRLENQKSTLIMGKQLSPDDVDHLNKRVDELKKIVRDEHLTKDQEIEDPIGKIKSLASAINESNREPLSDNKSQELKKYVSKKEVELEESLNAFKYVDENSGKRVVVVSLIPVQDSHWFIPLSLIDYMYFTIYTITTTGYGDIVPTTNFSKLLCSSANILEVFFLVVFFNALLSVKGENRFSRSTDKR